MDMSMSWPPSLFKPDQLLQASELYSAFTGENKAVLELGYQENTSGIYRMLNKFWNNIVEIQCTFGG